VPIEVVSDPGLSTSNSFVSLAEYAYYHERRIPLDPPVVVVGDTAARNVITATRVLSAMMTPKRTLRWDRTGKPHYYTSRTWTGAVTTSTQALAWPRTGMYDRFGREIVDNAIPVDLKDATSELAGQLGSLADRTLDNDVVVQGITRIKAGSVELEFKEMIESQILPDAVLSLLVPSWLTDEKVSYQTRQLVFETI
jgi:hypothetical protein